MIDTNLTPEQREAMTAWVAELRSGKYEQVKGVLCQINAEGNVVGYCCLGVLEELAIARGVINPALEDRFNRREYVIEKVDGGYSYASVMPHYEVLEWVGLNIDAAVIATVVDRAYVDESDWTETTRTREIGATDLNDDKGFSFEQIADAVEATYLSGDAA